MLTYTIYFKQEEYFEFELGVRIFTLLNFIVLIPGLDWVVQYVKYLRLSLSWMELPGMNFTFITKVLLKFEKFETKKCSVRMTWKAELIIEVEVILISV